MLRLLIAPRLGPVMNPWTQTFSAGTRISSALELAKSMLERDEVDKGSILLVSDLETAPDDVPAPHPDDLVARSKPTFVFASCRWRRRATLCSPLLGSPRQGRGGRRSRRRPHSGRPGHGIDGREHARALPRPRAPRVRAARPRTSGSPAASRCRAASRPRRCRHDATRDRRALARRCGRARVPLPRARARSARTRRRREPLGALEWRRRVPVTPETTGSLATRTLVPFDLAGSCSGPRTTSRLRRAVRSVGSPGSMIRPFPLSDPQSRCSATTPRRVSTRSSRARRIAAQRSRAAGLLGVVGLARLVSETQDRVALLASDRGEPPARRSRSIRATTRRSTTSSSRSSAARASSSPRARAARTRRRAEAARRARAPATPEAATRPRRAMSLTFLTPLGALIALGIVVPLVALRRIRRRAPARARTTLGVSRSPGGASLAAPARRRSLSGGILSRSQRRSRSLEWTRRPPRADGRGGVRRARRLPLDARADRASTRRSGSSARRRRPSSSVARCRTFPVGVASLTDRVLPHLFPSADENVSRRPSTARSGSSARRRARAS